jgi:hypothetical protein
MDLGDLPVTLKRLNLGAGSTVLEGYEPRDAKSGDSIYPLPDADGSLEEIRASHVLEHVSHTEVAEVMRHWVAKLAPGGLLKIAVPNFETIARDYLEGRSGMTQGYVFGGHVDEHDWHGCGFDADLLMELMLGCGLERLHTWTSEIRDCASLPVSLNIAGYKPSGPAKRCQDTVAVLSAPRFGAVLHFRCAFQAFSKANVPYMMGSGAYWHQVLSELLETSIADESVRYVLTCDYDTVFSSADVLELYRLMEALPNADAIFPLQSKRGPKGLPIFSMREGEAHITTADLTRHVLPRKTGHFGLTMFRASSLRSFARPWMNSAPAKDGRWTQERTDADIQFWLNWAAAGKSLLLAPRVVVGHLQEMVTWPGRDLRPIFQTPKDYDEGGMPEGARR